MRRRNCRELLRESRHYRRLEDYYRGVDAPRMAADARQRRVALLKFYSKCVQDRIGGVAGLTRRRSRTYNRFTGRS